MADKGRLVLIIPLVCLSPSAMSYFIFQLKRPVVAFSGDHFAFRVHDLAKDYRTHPAQAQCAIP